MFIPQWINFLLGDKKETWIYYTKNTRGNAIGGKGAVNVVFLLREFANVGQSRNCGTYQYRDVRLSYVNVFKKMMLGRRMETNLALPFLT